MPVDLCCPECIGDRWLKRRIAELSNKKGQCAYCGAKNQPIVNPEVLFDYFDLLLGIYKQDDNGKKLVSWLKEDWQLFRNPKIDEYRAERLLGEILDDGEIVRKNFIPSSSEITNLKDQWDELTNELQHVNRFFPETKFDLVRLEGLFKLLEDDLHDAPKHWFRARRKDREESFRCDEMGAPPMRKASIGRANPAGIPYLYLASTSKTAISEVRPHPGETICVATFRVPPNSQVVNLQEPRKLISPFQLGDESILKKLRGGDIEFLERLGESLSTPVIPSSAAIDYIATQYFCEYIKKIGFQGIVYSSSITEGYNLALFHPDLAGKAETVSESYVKKVNYQVRVIEE